MSKVFDVNDVINMLDDMDSEQEMSQPVDNMEISHPLHMNEESDILDMTADCNEDNTAMMIGRNMNISDTEYITLHIYEADSEDHDSVDDGRVEFTVHFDNESAQLIEKNRNTSLNICDEQAVDVNSESADISNNIISKFPVEIDENNNESLNTTYESFTDVTEERATQFVRHDGNDNIDNNEISPELTEETVEEFASQDGNDDQPQESAKRSRKRKKNFSDWKQNVRKRRRQSGQSYISSRGKEVRSRKLKHKEDCKGKCRFRCNESFSTQERSQLFDEFWSMSDDEKFAFYVKTTERHIKERTRTTSVKSRKTYSYRYFFISKGTKIRVCKEFYLSTLDISAKRISLCHEKADSNDHSYKRGIHTKRKIPRDRVQFVEDHINSFPRVQSHYCRESTTREYLESDLSVKKMYEMYKDKCVVEHMEPVKLKKYYEIFNHNFNLSFHIPRKDVCDICAEFEMSKRNSENPSTEKIETHMKDKSDTIKERKTDKADTSKMVICFDLENVLQCPRSNIGNFYYKRKLSVYNLTAHCSRNKTAYNALWGEHIAGRGGNEIASGLCTILDNIIKDFPETEHLTLWSDSCIPQNRNSIMTLALKTFLQGHPNVKTITQKYCTPGHSSIQEVDNIHSHIEKGLKICNVYSPLSLMRVMKRIRPRYSRIIQLSAKMFHNYKRSCKSLNFVNVPYSKVKCTVISGDKPFHVKYKTSFCEDSFTEVSIRGQSTRSGGEQERYLPIVRPFSQTPVIAKEKKLDIISMLSYMPKEDQDYFIAACNLKPLLPKSKRSKQKE